MRRKLIIATLISSFALGSCGVKGELKTPPPLWGEKKAEQPQEPQEAPETETPENGSSDDT